MRRTHSRATSAPRRGSSRGAPAPAGAPEAGATGAPKPLAHPAACAVVLVAAACVLASVTFHIIDTDFWQHLAVGRSLWSTRSIPHTQVWNWATWGAPDVPPSWLFCALIWPFWTAGGLVGLFAWRWLTTLTAFALAWATARRLGAQGLSSLAVLVVCGLVYRQRSQVRPETVAAVLLSLSLWLLESGRQLRASGRKGAGRSWWMVVVLWVWVNAHLSYFLGFVLLGIHLLDAQIAAWRRRGPHPWTLWGVALASAAAVFVNPFGWRLVWQPFDYVLHTHGTALFQGIGELRALGWSGNETNGSFVLLAGWPILMAWRARRHGFDLAEALAWAFFTAYTLPAQRFLSVYALVAAPYVARDVDAWISARRWPRAAEPWLAIPAVRAGLVAVACLAFATPEWTRPHSSLRPGIGIDLTRYPVAACDFIAAHGIRGRGFNQVRTGGYLLWRFWPDRTRLPFIDIHQGVSPEDRDLYAAVFTDPERWVDLDRRHRFDFALLDRRQYGSDRLYDRLDRDSTWALVFADDAALLYLRRDGPQAAAAESLAYRVVPGGRDGLEALRTSWSEDAALRAGARAELEHQMRSSRFNAGPASLLGDLALAEGRFADARGLLRHALEVDSETPRAHERLGIIALWNRDFSSAAAEFERERRMVGPSASLEVALGFARASAGDSAAARRHYRAALRLDPGNARARELLEALGRRDGP
jgi:Flp pilus assembly protein TadD